MESLPALGQSPLTSFVHHCRESPQRRADSEPTLWRFEVRIVDECPVDATTVRSAR